MTLDNLVLGKSTTYSDKYDASLLQSVPRSLSRDQIALPKELPFHGVDIWNGYEVSWLNSKGKPLIAILRCKVPVSSPNLIESKSFKLYLNSFNQSQFASLEQVRQIMQKDLSDCAGQAVELELLGFDCFAQLSLGQFESAQSESASHTNEPFDFALLDELDIEIDDYQIDPGRLSANESKTNNSQQEVKELLVSHLLKSNCLITNQPDWGSVLIKYQGTKIDHENLLKYLISFRQHNEFHEQCVERIFYDILSQCKPSKLTVYARYTRRGGLDINPFRSNFEAPYADVRLARQ
uniref:NADPH-dependent 7-cyano-7-deazaguanine reductase QueF n=1 Tax=Ningiella ruwaisensis TaxID=2364274 RepID=UPI001F4F903B|nr:NADPH-dependent 7-cyano-7-deazaguanine reductase QueF [Ningiella ruwaisensis]